MTLAFRPQVLCGRAPCTVPCSAAYPTLSWRLPQPVSGFPGLLSGLILKLGTFQLSTCQVRLTGGERPEDLREQWGSGASRSRDRPF